MRIKKIFFLLVITLLMIIPVKTYALPTSVIEFNINTYNLANSNNTYSFTSWLNSYTFTVTVNDTSIHNYYVMYIASTSTTYLNLSVSGGCTISCFNQTSYVKLINQTGSLYYFAVVLPVGKADCGVGTGQCVMDNNITLSGNHDGFTMQILGVDAVDDDNLINNNYQGFLNVINNQNSNTASIITNFANNMQTVNQSIINQAQQQHQDMQNIDNTMKSEDAPSNNDVSSKANDWASKNASTAPISGMVLMPITLLNAFVNGFGTSCSPYSLGELYDTELILPCIDISSYIGANLWSVIDVLISGLMIYAIGKKMVRIFNDFTNLRDNQVDELYGGGK